ncbi:hypothetical protein [Poseidonibacter ostreae]|uniref:Uncharacterized protein n=1 Tax=Poseidonibacter ostreae TaxID=2654171 RepID=A0A6L4WWX9_9BACT|nr:hypothetical protein [Poseidonibacter ostreae]KAB7891387.1 hypothetical protein GBG19_00695 [Poseidonibacter ostreae]
MVDYNKLDKQYILSDDEIKEVLAQMAVLKKNKEKLDIYLDFVAKKFENKTDFINNEDREKIYSSVASQDFGLEGVIFVVVLETIKENESEIFKKLEL